ncbi:unnamed protein product [Polarella glacialis]|uniref:J domain-containing protein n=1 Tax=Polarella glacialis TaxID=89957 RepID=A0A813K0F5_POLGL|nr:unnamed protein product [Polarella glacialis]
MGTEAVADSATRASVTSADGPAAGFCCRRSCSSLAQRQTACAIGNALFAPSPCRFRSRLRVEGSETGEGDKRRHEAEDCHGFVWPETSTSTSASSWSTDAPARLDSGCSGSCSPAQSQGSSPDESPRRGNRNLWPDLSQDFEDLEAGLSRVPTGRSCPSDCEFDLEAGLGGKLEWKGMLAAEAADAAATEPNYFVTSHAIGSTSTQQATDSTSAQQATDSTSAQAARDNCGQQVEDDAEASLSPGSANVSDATRDDQLATVPVNKAALGALQTGGVRGDAWQPSDGFSCGLANKSTADRVEVSLPTSWSSSLPPSGVDAERVRRWLAGEASWRLSWTALLDHAYRSHQPQEKKRRRPANAMCEGSRAREAVETARNELGETLRLHARPTSSEALLGALAGGLPIGVIQAIDRASDGTMGGLLQPLCPEVHRSQAVSSSLRWFCQGLAVSSRDTWPEDSLDLALAHQRLLLRCHPVAGGCSCKHLQAHIQLEVLRQSADRNVTALPVSDWMPRSRSGRISPGGRDSGGGGGSGLSDLEMIRLCGSVCAPSPQTSSQTGTGTGPSQDAEARPARRSCADRRRLSWQVLCLSSQRDDLTTLWQRLKHNSALQLLGLAQGASGSQVVRAYRNRARQLHPDRSGSTEAFQALQAAFDLLKNSELDPNDSQSHGESLTTLLRQYDLPSSEALAQEAEMAIGLAQTCLKLDSLGLRQENARRGVNRLAMHFAGAVQQAADAAGNVGLAAAAMPPKVVPLLHAVSQQCQAGGEAAANLLRDTQLLMKQLLIVAERGELAASLSREVKEKASGSPQSQERAQGLQMKDGSSHSVLANLVSQAALAAAAASTAVGEACTRAHQLATSLEAMAAAGASRTVADDPCGEEEKKPEDAQELPDEDRSSSGEESTGTASDGSRRPQKSRERRGDELVQHLNRELLALQGELRRMVVERPCLLAPVTTSEKEALFALVAEVISTAAHRSKRASEEASATLQPQEASWLPDAIEEELAAAFVAVAWKVVAAPTSTEARLLRLASLVDAAQLQQMLKVFLFDPCLAILWAHGQRSPQAEAAACLVRKRCDAALLELNVLVS